jgi:hypothetical protein
MRFVIVSGCDMRETWLALTSIVFAPMRFAMNRCRSGLIVRSSVETAYQLGFDRHAAWVVFVGEQRPFVWNLYSVENARFVGRHVAGEIAQERLLTQPSLVVGPDNAGGGWWSWIALRQRRVCFSILRIIYNAP